MLRVSRGESWVHSGDRVCGSDSPVSDELSTWEGRGGGEHTAQPRVTQASWCPFPLRLAPVPTLQPWAEMMRMSAGTRSPPLISTRSPTTSSLALICSLSPSRITVACCG